MLVGDAERADLGTQSADLRRHLDKRLVLLDQAVVAAFQTVQVQTRGCCGKEKYEKVVLLIWSGVNKLIVLYSIDLYRMWAIVYMEGCLMIK